jgi:hypothetical protein
MSSYQIHYSIRQRFGSGEPITIEISLYRDGFYISAKHLNNRLSKFLFDDPNQWSLWTQEVDKVAPMTNELLRKIREYYENI